MWNVTLKGLAAHKLRLVLTSLAIVLGVAFISGTFVLTDTLHNTFDGLLGSIYNKIDFQVRGAAQFPNQSAANAVRNPVPQSLVATVSTVPGVEAADGSVTGYAQFLSQTGKPIETGSEPTIGENFITNPLTSDLRITVGHPPATAGDVVMDASTAKKYGFHVGEDVRVLFQGGAVRTFVISGVAQYGSDSTLAGVTFAAFTLPVAQRAFGETGEFDHIDVVTKPGAREAAVQAAIRRALPRGVQVVTGKTVLDEQTASVNQSLSFFSTFLLVFALISLFVGAFTIFNTFSITVGQRTRELALLRAVGAGRRQVFRSVLAEAAITGAASSLIGTGLGVLAAVGLEGLMSALGYTLPSGPLVFEARTVLVSLAVGIGVTVISAVSPARRAVRVAPVAALSDRQETSNVSHRRWLGLAVASRVAGLALAVLGLAVHQVALVGLGAAVFFVGLAMVLPSLARPLSAAIGQPLAKALGATGKLGRANSMRNPTRTAQTASALMVGVALVSAMAVIGSSISSSATASVDGAVKADLIVTGTSSGNGSFSRSLAAELSRMPGATASLVVYGGQFEIRQSLEHLGAVSTADFSKTVNLHMKAGTAKALTAGELLVDSTTAKSDHLSVGSTVPVKFALTGPGTMRVGGIYKDNALVGKYLTGQAFFLSHYRNPLPGGVLLNASGGAAGTARLQSGVERVLAAYPTVQVQTRAQFEKSRLSSINQLLTLVYALLALAVLIALIGVVNTLMLSVFERTREIGLLRAVGMKRPQVRAMVRSESVILSVFGAVVGIVVGTLMGVAFVASLGLSNMSAPVPDLVGFFVLSGILGLVAATWPARRAAGLDVLAAIATE